MKRIVFLLVILMLTVSVFSSVAIFATSESNAVNARAAYVIEPTSGTVIYEQNAKDKHPIASMVKIMTALITLESIDKGILSLDEQITISESASGMGGSQMFIEANDIYSVSDLLKGIIVVSANDASVQMAERLAGSEEEFVTLMNARAKELGMNNTHFTNCTGLPAPSNYSSAEDVGIMTMELIKHKLYYNYSKIWMEDFKHPDGRTTGFVNTNKLIRFYNGCDGGKTGFTDEAMFCLSASAKRNDMRVIAVVMGAPSSKIRFAEATKLLNTAFAKYENKLIVDKDNLGIDPLNVSNGKTNSLKLQLDKSVYALIKKGEKVSYETKIELNEKVRAPIKAGEQVGTLYVIDKGVVISERPIIASEDIMEASYWDYVVKLLSNW